MSEARRAAIVEAALVLASLEGLSALSMQRVAVAAGVPKSVVLYHVGDRDGLWLAVAERAVLPWAEVALVAGDPREALNRWLAETFERLAREPACVRVQAALRAAPAATPGRERVLALDERLRRELVALLEHGHSHHAWQAPDPMRTANLAMAVLDGLTVELLRREGPDAVTGLHAMARGAVLELVLRR